MSSFHSPIHLTHKTYLPDFVEILRLLSEPNSKGWDGAILVGLPKGLGLGRGGPVSRNKDNKRDNRRTGTFRETGVDDFGEGSGIFVEKRGRHHLSVEPQQ